MRQRGSIVPFNCLVFCLAAIAILVNTTQAASIDESDVYGPGVVDVLNAVISARAQLESWVMKARCSENQMASEERETQQLDGVFDGKTGQFRFETRGNCRMSIMPSNSPDALRPDDREAARANVKQHNCVSLVVQNKEHMVEWYGLGEPKGGATCHIELRDLRTQPSYLASAAINPRSAGLIDVTAENRWESVESVFTRFALNASSVVLKENAGELRVVYEYPEKIRRVVQIDREHGFTIVRSALVILDEDQNEKAAPRIEARAKWELKDGICVPVIISWSRSNVDGAVANTNYRIKWESVNPETIDDKLFDYRTFNGFWPDLNVVERRKGQLKVLEAKNLDHFVKGRGGVDED